MKSRLGFLSGLITFAAVKTAFAAADLTADLEFIGNPQMERWPNNATARACLDLQFYQGRLFNGGGEVESNPGAPWISSIDPFDNSTRFEFAPGTEAIANYRIASWGDLLTSAQDPHEGDANLGHVFTRTPDGKWSIFKSVGGSLTTTGSSTVANNTHCWDMEEFDGRVFVAGYNLMSSTDRCKTFSACTDLTSAYVSIVYAASKNKTLSDNHLRRQIQLLRFGDSALFAVPNTLLQPNVMDDARTCKQEVFRYDVSTHKFAVIPQRASDIYPDLSSSDYQLVGRNLTYFSTDTYARTLARIWHTTPFKDRVLYVGCYDTPPYSSVVSPWEDKIALTSYPLPLMGCSAAVVDNQIKATRINFGDDKANYPWDFAVVGDTVYALTSRYVADGQKNHHIVWKSTDGVNFTEVFSFDFHQNFISLEYRDGWFYLGVGCKTATTGYTYDKTADESGSIYRVRCPQEPIQVMPSVDTLEIAEGSSAKVTFRLSAQPASNVTLRVGATLANSRFTTDKTALTFTTANWATPQEVTVSVAGNGTLDANRSGAVVCGAPGFDVERGEFYSAELASGTISTTFTDAELVAPANGEIRTADDFYCAMAYPDGDYKLMADIDLEGSLFTTVDEFTGTLNGNGFTLSGLGDGPIAKRFSGVVKNLTLDGEGAEVKGLSRGLFFDEANGGAFTNCTVKGYTLKAETSDAYLGLFVGVATGPISFCRCSTDANCLLNQANQHDTSLGGFVAKVALPAEGGACIVFESCTNNAAISATDNYRTGSGAGGFVGVINGTLPATPTNEVLFVRCVNEGPITSAGRNNCLGGLVGRFNATYNKKASVDTKFVLCANEADITVPENGTQSGSAGGFTGNVGSSNNIIFSQCTSTGTITAPAVITTGPFAAVGETATDDSIADDYPEPPPEEEGGEEEEEDPEPTEPQDLTANLEYVAYPAFVRYQGNNMNASSIIDLQVYHDLIFSGYGNWDGNQGPVTMVPLEPNLKTLTDEGELGTDSTETLRVFEDGNLYVPATDRRESHANRGLFFRRNASGEWHTHTAIVVNNDVSTHFWDMMDFNGRLFLAGYGLASSSDGGTTWSRVESNPQNTRYLGFIKCGDELFCRDQSFIAFDYKTGKLVKGITNYNSYYWHWNKQTSLFDKINNNDYTEINGGVDRSSWALSNADLTNYSTTSGHPWHCTPFKDRSLYILGSANAITVNGKKCAPSGTFPAVLITAWAENGMLKGEGVNLDGEYPYDLTVFGDAIYALTFKYKSDSQTVEHAVWKSTDGVSFTKILFFDFQQVMASIEYHNGYFYFGVAHLSAQPLLGTLAAQTDLSGRIYRVWCPQEKIQVVATPVATSVNEGASTQIGYKLSAKPKTNVTLAVGRTDGNANFTASPASLTFTPSNWNVAQNVTVSLADTATGDATTAAITCGVATPDSVRGAFASESVTASSVVMTPVVNDFAPTVASVTVQNRLVPASVSAALDSFGAENGVAKDSATLVVTAYSDAGKTQVVATKSASVTALGESVSVSFPELEPGRLYYFDITAKTTDALATVVSRDFTSPIATREEDLVDLTDDLSKREGITGNSNVRPFDSSGAWDNTTSVTFGGYKRPSYSVYEFTEPTVANGFGLLGIADQQESRMPLNYSFAGSNDTNGEWTVLFAVTNAPVWGAEGEWRRHLCDNTTAYKFYKVSLDENRVKGAGDAHVYSAEAELYFIGESETPPEQPETPQDLTAQLEFVGNPTLERWLTRGTANSILDIEVNDDRLFFACGEWSGNSGPVFMKSFDPYFCTYTNEYAAGTEGVEVLRTFSDGGLYFPAIDHMDKGSYDNGYWFKRAKGGEWSAGFANGTSKNLYTHVYDMQQFGDWMFLYSGCPVGSKDGGANWLRLDGLDSNKQNGSLLRCGDEFFCVEAYPMDFGTGTNPNATPLSDQYTRHGPTVWHWNATTEKFTSTVEPTWDNLAPEIVLSDCDLVTTNASIVGRPGRFWHTTPFKDRCLYVIGDEYSDRTYTVNGKSVTLKPIGTRPEIAVSAYAENGALKGTRIHLPAKTWPIDFTVAGDTAYMLAFSYVPDTQMVRHGVWKSTDGVSFTEILTVDYPQVMQAFDYHMGYFYFGVAHQNAEPNLGPIKSGTKESAGDIYRVYCPQEPVTAVASVSTLPVSEGGSSVINYTLSAQPAADVTLAVRLLGGAGLTLSMESIVFTRANWNSPHPVTVSYPQNDRRDAESVVLVCGIETPTSLRGRFDCPEVTASIVSVELTDDDRAPTISAEAFDNAKIPFTYTATLADLGSLNGQAAGSATVTLTAYDDDTCTHAVDSDSKTVTTTGEVSLTLTNLVRGAWYTFVAEARSSEESAVRSSMRLRAPIGTAAQLVDLTDDLSNRAGTYATNAAIGPAGNSGAWDNDLTKYFGGYKDPREAIYEFNTPMVVNGFGLRGMGNPASDEQDRHPSGYSLYGTADTNDTWTLLAQVTGDPIWSPSGEWRRIYAPNTTAYKYYKLTLDSAQMPSMPRIAAAEVELYFIGEPDTPPEEPEEPVGLNNLGAPEGDRFDLSLQQTWPAADYGAEVCLWRYDRYAALSFGHDDNCDWDIPFLLRESERNGFKLTWWLITKNIGDTGSTSGSGNWPEWRECFAAGHAIESHSHTHEWAGGGQTVQAAAAAAGMSVEDYVEFCMYSNSLAVIREKIPGCKPSTLAFPGGESYPEIANRYFVSGRSVGPYINRANAINYQSVNASSSGIDPGYINAMLGGRGGSKALAGWKSAFNDSKNYRGWFVPFLHTESTHDGLPNAGHEQGVAEQIQRFELLGRHRRHLWLGTYPAIAKYGQSRDTATLTVVKKTASEITFTLVDQMRDDWYDEPLTVKVRLPAAWAQSGVAATQGGNALDAFYIEREGAKYALVNAVPDRGTVTLVPAAANSGAWDETSYEAPTYTYQVRFFDTDGTTLLKTIIAHPINTSAAELAPVIYNPGYRLSWQTADGVSIDDITDDVDFKAVWTATDEKPKAVFVDDSTGEELTSVETVYGDRPAQPTDLPAREGYIAYWEPDLGPIVSNTQYRVKYMRDDDPIPGAIIVRTAEEFCDAMANHPDAVIRMVRDIDISGYGYTAVPEFSGTFKAYGHILTGLGDTSLCVTNSGAFVGLKVLGDSDAEHPVLASGYGVFAVVSDAGVFTDCRVDGYAIRANAQYLAYGVFVGTALKGTAFTNCTVGATCSIDQGSKPNNEIGGFVGELKVTDPSGTLVTFAHCTNEAPILVTGDYNEAHGDGGFIGRASGCGAASTPEILFVDCAELGLVSSSGGKSNLGGYIGYVPGLKVNSTCKVIFEGCTTTMPVGASANAVGEWIGLASNVVVEQKEYIPPEEPDNPPVGPDDPPVEPEQPTEFVTNDWFNVEFEDDGYKAGSDWTKTSTDKSGGTWSGDDGGATTLDGTTFVVTLTDTFEGELRYTPSKASDADADVVVEGSMEVSEAAREIRPEGVPFALTFENKQSGNLTPVAYIGGAWHSFGTTGFAADAWVDWKVEIDQASTNAPRIKVTVTQKGGAVETSGWIAGGFAAKQVSGLSYIGVGSFGDFKARYLTVKGGEVIELVPPEFAADGSALGFRPGIGETRMFTLKITNPVKGAYYTVLTSTTLEGPFLPEGGSVLFDQDSGTLTLEVSADTPQKFAKILVSVSPID